MSFPQTECRQRQISNPFSIYSGISMKEEKLVQQTKPLYQQIRETKEVVWKEKQSRRENRLALEWSQGTWNGGEMAYLQGRRTRRSMKKLVQVTDDKGTKGDCKIWVPYYPLFLRTRAKKKRNCTIYPISNRRNSLTLLYFSPFYFFLFHFMYAKHRTKTFSY